MFKMIYPFGEGPFSALFSLGNIYDTHAKIMIVSSKFLRTEKYTYRANILEDSGFLGGDAVAGLVVVVVLVREDVGGLLKDLGVSLSMASQVGDIGGDHGHDGEKGYEGFLQSKGG